MKLENFKEVEDLYKQRSEAVHRIAVVNATGHDLTRHFNVHIHGTAQPAAVAEIAARALLGHYTEELRRIDNALVQLGVTLPQSDPLASVRPEVIVAQAQQQNEMELKTALTTIIRTAVNRGGAEQEFVISDVVSVQEGGDRIPMGSWKITARRVA